MHVAHLVLADNSMSVTEYRLCHVRPIRNRNAVVYAHELQTYRFAKGLKGAMCNGLRLL